MGSRGKLRHDLSVSNEILQSSSCINVTHDSLGGYYPFCVSEVTKGMVNAATTYKRLEF